MNTHSLERERIPVPPPPQFDDERTVLTARRVVPFEKIDAKVRRRRQWFLGGAFALAMLLGSATALVASYLRLRSAANAEMMAAPLAIPEVVATETPVSENTEEPAVTSAEAPKTEPIVKRRMPVRRPSVSIEPRNIPKLSEDEDLQRIREAVLVDEWQERRARRATKRERRNRADHHDRNLSNIDEIFEGRKRPY